MLSSRCYTSFSSEFCTTFSLYNISRSILFNSMSERMAHVSMGNPSSLSNYTANCDYVRHQLSHRASPRCVTSFGCQTNVWFYQNSQESSFTCQQLPHNEIANPGRENRWSAHNYYSIETRERLYTRHQVCHWDSLFQQLQLSLDNYPQIHQRNHLNSLLDTLDTVAEDCHLFLRPSYSVYSIRVNIIPIGS